MLKERIKNVENNKEKRKEKELDDSNIARDNYRQQIDTLKNKVSIIIYLLIMIII